MKSVTQGSEGKLKKQNELKNALTTLSPESEEVGSWINNTFSLQLQTDQAARKYLMRTPNNIKFEILNQAANDPDGIGKLGLSPTGVVYVPASKA